MTVFVSGFAVKRITALTLVSGRLPIGSPPLEPDDPPLEEELCEPFGCAPFCTYAVTCTSHVNITADVSWKRTVRAPLVSFGLNNWSERISTKLNSAGFDALVPLPPLSALMTAGSADADDVGLNTEHSVRRVVDQVEVLLPDTREGSIRDRIAHQTRDIDLRTDIDEHGNGVAVRDACHDLSGLNTAHANEYVSLGRFVKL